MADVTGTRPAAGPDRSGFSIALITARGLLVQVTGVFNDTAVDPVGTIGRRALPTSCPTTASGHASSNAPSPCTNVRGTVDRTRYKATIGIDILTTRTA